ncbi:MAG: hypothetical protein M1438_14405 [Deltaproteobacteria bacterium]|nr:hypothetical protein [Deltaproteobacteria bacterium]
MKTHEEMVAEWLFFTLSPSQNFFRLLRQLPPKPFLLSALKRLLVLSSLAHR